MKQITIPAVIRVDFVTRDYESADEAIAAVKAALADEDGNDLQVSLYPPESANGVDGRITGVDVLEGDFSVVEVDVIYFDDKMYEAVDDHSKNRDMVAVLFGHSITRYYRHPNVKSRGVYLLNSGKYVAVDGAERAYDISDRVREFAPAPGSHPKGKAKSKKPVKL